MPTYDCICQQCRRVSDIRAMMAEETKGLKPTCPQCGARKAVRRRNTVNVLTGRLTGTLMSTGCGPNAGPRCGGGKAMP